MFQVGSPSPSAALSHLLCLLCPLITALLLHPLTHTASRGFADSYRSPHRATRYSIREPASSLHLFLPHLLWEVEPFLPPLPSSPTHPSSSDRCSSTDSALPRPASAFRVLALSLHQTLWRISSLLFNGRLRPNTVCTLNFFSLKNVCKHVFILAVWYLFDTVFQT